MRYGCLLRCALALMAAAACIPAIGAQSPDRPQSPYFVVEGTSDVDALPLKATEVAVYAR